MNFKCIIKFTKSNFFLKKKEAAEATSLIAKTTILINTFSNIKSYLKI